MIAAAIFAVPTSSGGGPAPSGPTAGFTVSDSDPIMGDTIQLTDASTGAPTSWAWYSNGGLFSIQQNPQFYAGGVGVFVITLKVTNAFGSNTTPTGTTITVHGGQPGG